MDGKSIFGEKAGKVSSALLKGTAAVVWLIGGGILSAKGSGLLLEAADLHPGFVWSWIGFPAGVVLGVLKGKFLFVPSCRKNLARIDRLDSPRIWQFFSPKFFFALLLMIATGASLSRIAHGRYLMLILVGILDLSIASALLISFPAYLPNAFPQDA